MGGFCWNKVLLPTCPSWRQLAQSDLREVRTINIIINNEQIIVMPNKLLQGNFMETLAGCRWYARMLNAVNVGGMIVRDTNEVSKKPD